MTISEIAQPISDEDPSWKPKAFTKLQEARSELPGHWELPVNVLGKFSMTSKDHVLDLPQMFLSSEEIEITKLQSASSLVEKIVSGEYSALQVLEAFSHRAAIATQVTNCCTELMFSYGRKRALYLDEYLKEHGKPIGPFHGLPISVKDSFKIPGYDSTLGYVSFIGNKKDFTEPSPMIKLMIDLGAVPFVKTNLPQTLMTADSENNIFGRTLNPINLSLTAGGSSGGEGSLVKQRGSVFGIGTDIAGSIRIPALCNGVYGFKPTTNKIPFADQVAPADPTYLGFEPSAGPLATNWDDIELFMRHVLNSDLIKYDKTCIPYPYNGSISLPSVLKIGLITEVDYFPLHPTMIDILEKAAGKLRKAGHEVQELRSDIVDFYKEAFKTCFGMYMIGASELKNGFDILKEEDEPLIDSLKMNPGVVPPKSIDDLYKLKASQQKVKAKATSLFDNFDIIICPGNAGAAPPHDEYGIPPFTCIWNLIDFPAAIIPFSTIDKEYDVDTSQYPPELLQPRTYPVYKENTYLGAPGHIQIVTPTFQDEKLLEIGKVIDSVLNA